jgi:hypothetical protein
MSVPLADPARPHVRHFSASAVFRPAPISIVEIPRIAGQDRPRTASTKDAARRDILAHIHRKFGSVVIGEGNGDCGIFRSRFRRRDRHAAPGSCRLLRPARRSRPHRCHRRWPGGNRPCSARLGEHAEASHAITTEKLR